MSFDNSDDSARALARLAFENHHDSLASDQSQDNYLRALTLAHELKAEGCPSCELLVDVIPAVGTRWVVEQHHEPGCVKVAE